jgi:hypothetical protein
MKSNFRRILAGLAESSVLTHTLPYETRLGGRSFVGQS